jgi:hypothetical protein
MGKEVEKHTSSRITYESLPLILKFFQYMMKIVAGTTHDHHLAHHLKHMSCRFII